MKDLLLRARVVVKTSNVEISSLRFAGFAREMNFKVNVDCMCGTQLKYVRHVQHANFSSLNQSNQLVTLQVLS